MQKIELVMMMYLDMVVRQIMVMEQALIMEREKNPGIMMDILLETLMVITVTLLEKKEEARDHLVTIP